MFDPYSQMSAHARKEAFLHPRKLTTWQDAVSENRDIDLNLRRQELSSGSPVFSFVTSLAARLQRWRQTWLHEPLKQVASQQDVTIKPHSQVQR